MNLANTSSAYLLEFYSILGCQMLAMGSMATKKIDLPESALLNVHPRPDLDMEILGPT